VDLEAIHRQQHISPSTTYPRKPIAEETLGSGRRALAIMGASMLDMEEQEKDQNNERRRTIEIKPES
jgi:hypothetical protein